jgi:hypothetical protein
MRKKNRRNIQVLANMEVKYTQNLVEWLLYNVLNYKSYNCRLDSPIQKLVYVGVADKNRKLQKKKEKKMK